MKASDLCDACGGEVAPGEGHREELSIGADAMCPTPMAFHDECWQQASHLWQRDEANSCAVDPLFPETAQWTAPGTAPS